MGFVLGKRFSSGKLICRNSQQIVTSGEFLLLAILSQLRPCGKLFSLVLFFRGSALRLS